MSNSDEMFQAFLFPPEDDTDEPEVQSTVLAPEPLFAALMRDAVAKLWPGDAVMADFVAHIVGPLSDYLGHVGAKGGEFVTQREAEGKTVEERYSRDQSQRAHLINGLLPVLHVAQVLQAWNAPQFRAYDDTLRRVFIAGYVLHDYLKLPGVENYLQAQGLIHGQGIGSAQLPAVESIFRAWCRKLGLDAFLAPLGGSEEFLHDLIYVACNTQTRWGTLHNLSMLPRLALLPAQLDLAEQLSRIADLLAYVGRTPQEAAQHGTIQRELATLSDRMARLSFHHVADNRGVLTNMVQNAALSAMAHEYRVPLLYAPSGVVYLEHKQAPPPPSVIDVAEAVVQRIKQVVGHALVQSRQGFKRDGKGIKHAGYYWLFFETATFIRLGAQATFDVIHEGKTPSSGKRFRKMKEQGWMSDDVDLDLPDDLRVDQLAEWCYLAEKQVGAKLPNLDVAALLMEMLGLQDLEAQFAAVPRDNRAGGVGYHWYFAAGHYLKRHQGLDPASWRERVEALAGRLADAVNDARPQDSKHSGATNSDWDDLTAYVSRILTLGDGTPLESSRDCFIAELERYGSAKRRGAGKTQVCALCSSPYRVGKQQEAAVLFAPQVYSNKRLLHSTDALREICSICSMEMMLRQILMNPSAATGGDFEGQRVRYLYFYPTYFFTPETLEVLRRAYISLQQISFTELRRQLVGTRGKVDLSPAILQHLEPLLLLPEEPSSSSGDRHVRLRFPENEPITFYFIGLRPRRDAKDAEAWVHPAFLALLLPLCLDVKVVASESLTPLFLEADEFPETVMLDGPHAAISYLTGGQTRINVDQVLPMLQRLTISYLIHTDANSQMTSRGYDYRWQDLPALARALDQTSLYAFHYLKKWQRQQRQNRDTLPAAKARQYLNYVSYLDGGEDMSHARELTLLYRQFYRARRYNSNSILRPVSIAARVILEADPRLFAEEGLVEAVFGELRSFSERAQREGLAFFPKGSTWESREAAMRQFASYFVNQLFLKVFRGDRSVLRGRQLNLLKSACEVVYRDEAAGDRAEDQLVESADDTSIEA